MKEVTNETYFDDVKLQMDSKLWGEEYSKLNIPKKVKVMHVDNHGLLPLPGNKQ